jgi:hypothetical protein
VPFPIIPDSLKITIYLVNELYTLEDLSCKVSTFGLGQDVIPRRDSFEQFAARQIFGQNNRLQIALVIVEETDYVFL